MSAFVMDMCRAHSLLKSWAAGKVVRLTCLLPRALKTLAHSKCTSKTLGRITEDIIS